MRWSPLFGAALAAGLLASGAEAVTYEFDLEATDFVTTGVGGSPPTPTVSLRLAASFDVAGEPTAALTGLALLDDTLGLDPDPTEIFAAYDGSTARLTVYGPGGLPVGGTTRVYLQIDEPNGPDPELVRLFYSQVGASQLYEAGSFETVRRTAPVPLPGAGWMALAGLLALGAARRRAGAG